MANELRGKTYKVNLQTDLNLPPNARLFCLKKHPEAHPHRYGGMIHSLKSLTYFASGMTNSEGLALQKQMLKHLTGKAPEK